MSYQNKKIENMKQNIDLTTDTYCKNQRDINHDENPLASVFCSNLSTR